MCECDCNCEREEGGVFHDHDRLDVDNVNTLVELLIQVLSNPIEIQVVTGSNGVPTKIILIPGTPKNN